MSLTYAAAASPAANRTPVRQLAVREAEVVTLVAAGVKDGEISSRLGITPPEVRRHISSASEKLGASDRLELVIHAIHYGVVTPR